MYNNDGGSVFGAAVCHAMINVSWMLFPNYGSHWDPRITGPLLAVAALMGITPRKWGSRQFPVPC